MLKNRIIKRYFLLFNVLIIKDDFANCLILTACTRLASVLRHNRKMKRKEDVKLILHNF